MLKQIKKTEERSDFRVVGICSDLQQLFNVQEMGGLGWISLFVFFVCLFFHINNSFTILHACLVLCLSSGVRILCAVTYAMTFLILFSP